MRPHPLFKDRSIPMAHVLGDVTLKALSIDDLDRDFSVPSTRSVSSPRRRGSSIR
jgi:hypothetical protein